MKPAPGVYHPNQDVEEQARQLVNAELMAGHSLWTAADGRVIYGACWQALVKLLKGMR